MSIAVLLGRMLSVPVVITYIISLLREVEKQINRCAKNGRGTRDQDRERAERIFHEPHGHFLLKLNYVLADEFPGHRSERPDGTDSHHGSLQVPVCQCLLAMFLIRSPATHNLSA
jgi:hypothetical protein